MAAAIALHNFPEGFASAPFWRIDEPRFTITAVIIIHDIPEGKQWRYQCGRWLLKVQAYLYSAVGVPMGLGALFAQPGRIRMLMISVASVLQAAQCFI